MDGNHFDPGYLPYTHQQRPRQSLGSFGNLSAPTHPLDSPAHHPTLPPLHTHHDGGYSHFGNLSFAQPNNQPHLDAPPTSHAPSTSSMPGHSAAAFPHLISPSYTPGSMPPPIYQPPYPSPQSMMYPSSTNPSMPSTTSATALPAIRPMPPGGMAMATPMAGLPNLASGAGLVQQQQPVFMQNEEAPTHVVGSQGRRGILPSAPGRPDPAAGASAQSTKSMIPQKDADGKYPCPHCNKTYLHAKHLKRHLLRHTGDRPYMCHLCRDTFSRSDILKRHFQKCSIRRGNPTGANHLAHQRRNGSNSSRQSISQLDGPIGLAGLPEVVGASGMMTNSPTVNSDLSTRTSRANSLLTPGGLSHRGSVAGLGIMTASTANGDHMGTSAGYQQGMPAFAMTHDSNGQQLPPNYGFNGSHMNGNAFGNPQQMALGQQNSRFDNGHHNGLPANSDPSATNDDWSRMFNQGGQDGFIANQPVNSTSHDMAQIKPEQDVNGNFGTHLQMHAL